MKYYILNEKGEPVGSDLSEWAHWMERNWMGLRLVGNHQFKWSGGDVGISTIFLGLNHQYGNGPPLLWETMVFGGGEDLDQDQRRCGGNREQAEAMHMAVVAMVKQKLNIKDDETSTEASHRSGEGLPPGLH